MTLTAADVAEIMRLVEQSGFDELNLEVDGMKLSLRRGASAEGEAAGVAASPTLQRQDGAEAAGLAPAEQRSPSARGGAGGAADARTGAGGGAGGAPGGATSIVGAGGAGTVASAVGSAPSSDPTLHDVPSPLLGTFYRSPKPGAPPFVDIGATVDENTVVAIIEVMKLMNTVRAGVRGTVAEVLLTDGALAEFGQPLFRVRKAAS